MNRPGTSTAVLRAVCKRGKESTPLYIRLNLPHLSEVYSRILEAIRRVEHYFTGRFQEITGVCAVGIVYRERRIS